MLYILQLDTNYKGLRPTRIHGKVLNKWQDDISWWLEIIRQPERLFPKEPQIIFTTNGKRLSVEAKQITKQRG